MNLKADVIINQAATLAYRLHLFNLFKRQMSEHLYISRAKRQIHFNFWKSLLMHSFLHLRKRLKSIKRVKSKLSCGLLHLRNYVARIAFKQWQVTDLCIQINSHKAEQLQRLMKLSKGLHFLRTRSELFTVTRNHIGFFEFSCCRSLKRMCLMRWRTENFYQLYLYRTFLFNWKKAFKLKRLENVCLHNGKYSLMRCCWSKWKSARSYHVLAEVNACEVYSIIVRRSLLKSLLMWRKNAILQKSEMLFCKTRKTIQLKLIWNYLRKLFVHLVPLSHVCERFRQERTLQKIFRDWKKLWLISLKIVSFRLFMKKSVRGNAISVWRNFVSYRKERLQLQHLIADALNGLPTVRDQMIWQVKPVYYFWQKWKSEFSCVKIFAENTLLADKFHSRCKLLLFYRWRSCFSDILLTKQSQRLSLRFMLSMIPFFGVYNLEFALTTWMDTCRYAANQNGKLILLRAHFATQKLIRLFKQLRTVLKVQQKNDIALAKKVNSFFGGFNKRLALGKWALLVVWSLFSFFYKSE